MANSLDELIREMNGSATPQRISLAWEVLPGLSDGLLHAVDPDPDAYWSDQFSVSLCGTTLQIKDGHVRDAEMCFVCQTLCGERQREFDAEVA
jgi:hypothetical protein